MGEFSLWHVLIFVIGLLFLAAIGYSVLRLVRREARRAVAERDVSRSRR